MTLIHTLSPALGFHLCRFDRAKTTAQTQNVLTVSSLVTYYLAKYKFANHSPFIFQFLRWATQEDANRPLLETMVLAALLP